MMPRGIRTTARNHRSLILACALLGTVAMTALAPTHAEDASGAAIQYDIPSQPLSSALILLGAQSGLAIAFPEAQFASQMSPAISGALTVRQALDRALTGSGFTYEFI